MSPNAAAYWKASGVAGTPAGATVAGGNVVSASVDLGGGSSSSCVVSVSASVRRVDLRDPRPVRRAGRVRPQLLVHLLGQLRQGFSSLPPLPQPTAITVSAAIAIQVRRCIGQPNSDPVSGGQFVPPCSLREPILASESRFGAGDRVGGAAQMRMFVSSVPTGRGPMLPNERHRDRWAEAAVAGRLNATPCIPRRPMIGFSTCGPKVVPARRQTSHPGRTVGHLLISGVGHEFATDVAHQPG